MGGGAASVWAFEAIGAPWEIVTEREVPATTRAAVEGLIARFDGEWSRFRTDSTVSRLSRGEGSLPAPQDAERVVAAYAELAEATDGAVDPLIGGSLERLGYDAAYSFREGQPAAAPAGWRKRLRADGGRLSLEGEGVIDIGALGKGLLVDRVLEVVGGSVTGDVVVDASGDLAVRGAPVRVGLEHPYDPSRAIGVWTVQDAALCASAANRRAWGDGLHHVLDARTGLPVRTVVATWVLAPDALWADALATALFFDGGPELAASWNAHWVRMRTDGRVEWSPGFPGEVFS